jgi:hypothetical protein
VAPDRFQPRWHSSDQIHQDANLFVLELDPGSSIDFELATGSSSLLDPDRRHLTCQCIALNTRDAAEISAETITLEAQTKSHYILIEMKQQ